MSHASRALRASAAAVLLVASCALVAAAADAAAVLITLTVPTSPIACRVETPVSALVVDAHGATIAGRTVAWSLMPVASSQDSVVEYETVTGSQGVATTRIWIDCIPGPRTLNATVDGVTASVALDVSMAGMPATSTDAPPARSLGGADSSLIVITIVAAALAGAAFVLRRTATVRRPRTPSARTKRRIASGGRHDTSMRAPATGLPH